MKKTTTIIALALCLSSAINLHAQAKPVPEKPQPKKAVPANKPRVSPPPPKAAADAQGLKSQTANKSVAVQPNVPAAVQPNHESSVSSSVVIGAPFVPPPVVVGVRRKWLIEEDPEFIVRDANVQAEAEMLREAYILMSRADADYLGHRIAAMRQTAAAAQHLGMTLRGDSPGNQNQFVSDNQLRDARGLLVEAQQGLAAKGRPNAAREAENAIRQIDTALSIR